MIALNMANSELYNLFFVFSLRGAVDIAAFKQAWSMLIQRHAIFRTTFVLVEHDGAPSFVQVVRKSLDIAWHEESCAADEAEAVMARLQAESMAAGFELGGPCMRLTLLKIADDYYKFIWASHHAVMDAWCLQPVFSDLRAAYVQRPVPERTPFKLYMRHQLSLSQNEAAAFWREYLAEAQATPYPDSLHHERQIVRCSQHHHAIMVGSFAAFLKQHAITPATLFRAAWAMVLGLAADVDDVLFGCIHSGRDVPVAGVSEMLGMCLQTLPVRVRIDKSSTVLDFLRRVQDEFRDVARHGHVGLRRIRQQATTFNGNTALFQTTVNFRSFSEDFVDTEKLLPFEMAIDGGLQVEELPVFLSVDYGKDAMHVKCEYDPHIVKQEDMARAMYRLEQTMQAFTEKQWAPLRDLDMLTVDERATLERGIFAPEGDVTTVAPVHRFLHEMFEARAHDSADSVAIDYEGRELVTYAELNVRANRIAALLRDEHGVQPDAIVPLCLDKSPDMVAAMLGVLKAGGAYAPLDPTHPVDRLAHIVSETEARVVLTTTAHAHLFNVATVCLDQDAVNTDLATRSSDNVAVDRLHERNLAYVIYTSGSTGRPKGVLIEHEAVVTSMTAHIALYCATPGRRVLQYASYTFDVSVTDVFVCLGSGGVLCMAPIAALREDLQEVVKRMRVEQVELSPAPAMWITPAQCVTLKTLTLSGEQGMWLLNVKLARAVTDTAISAGDSAAALGRPCARAQLVRSD